MDEEFRALVQKVDPQMHDVVYRHPSLTLPPLDHLFEALVRIVAGQQLSVKAAATVVSRIEDALNGNISPQGIRKKWDTMSSGGGTQRRQVPKRHLCIAEFAGTDADPFETVLDKPWEEHRPTLLSLQGIGPWSADMYAMFGLGMQDIFSSMISAFVWPWRPIFKFTSKNPRSMTSGLCLGVHTGRWLLCICGIL